MGTTTRSSCSTIARDPTHDQRQKARRTYRAGADDSDLHLSLLAGPELCVEAARSGVTYEPVALSRRRVVVSPDMPPHLLAFPPMDLPRNEARHAQDTEHNHTGNQKDQKARPFHEGCDSTVPSA